MLSRYNLKNETIQIKITRKYPFSIKRYTVSKTYLTQTELCLKKLITIYLTD